MSEGLHLQYRVCSSHSPQDSSAYMHGNAIDYTIHSNTNIGIRIINKSEAARLRDQNQGRVLRSEETRRPRDRPHHDAGNDREHQEDEKDAARFHGVSLTHGKPRNR